MAETAAVGSVDAEHPWPWLEAFTEGAAGYFHGRDDDIAALLQAVTTAPVTVLFGRSGLGKTSLLQAGLFPRLAQRRLFPVLLRRVDHGPGGAELSARWLARLDGEAAARGLTWQGPPDALGASDRARLWERLHRADAGWRDAAGARWTPLLVLDQFEEAFTLQTDATAQRRVFEELGDLFENRIPQPVAARINADESLLDTLDLDAQPYRCLLALREDFLAELEAWVALVPRLAAQRLRLLPMARAQALAAVQQTGGALVDPTSAARIVDFLGQRADGGGVEPALLSLVCASLNDERLERSRSQLDVENLETSGGRILDRFYDQAFAAVPAVLRDAAHAWVESDLITAGGTRRPYPREALTPELHAVLETLVQRRLLRVENAEHGDFVELVHDRLAAVARQRAAAARERAELEAAEQARRRAAARRRRFWRNVAALGAVLLVFFVGAFLFTLDLYQEAQEARSIAERSGEQLRIATLAALEQKRSAEEAEGRATTAAAAAARSASEAASAADRALANERLATEARDAAQRQTRAATAFRLAADGQTLAAGAREGGLVRALLSMLAGYRLAQGTTPQALAAAQAALQSQTTRGLVWVRDAPAADVAAHSRDGRLLVTGGSSGAINLHDGASGVWLGTLPLRATGDAVTALAMSRDGALLVSGHRSGMLRRWDLAQRRELPALPNEGGAVVLAAFVGDELVVVGARGSAARWDLTRSAPVARRPPGSAEVRTAAVLPDGRLLAVATYASVEILDGATLQTTGSVAGSVGTTALAFRASDRTLVLGESSGEIRYWSSELRRVTSTIQLQGGSVRWLHASGGQILAATDDGRLHLGWAPSGLSEGLKAHAAGTAWTAVFGAGGSAITTIGEDRVATRWQLDASLPFWLAPPLRHLGDVHYSADGRHLLVASDRGLQRLPRDGPLPATAEGPAERLGKTCYSADARFAAATALGGPPLRIVDTTTGRTLAATDFDPGFDAPCAISADGRRVVLGLGDRWQLFDGALAQLGPAVVVTTAGDDITALALGHGVVVAGTQGGSVSRWDLATRRRLDAPEPLHRSRVGALAISPDGRWLASAGGERRWRLTDLRTLVDVRGDGGIGHGAPVRAIAFSRDSRHLVSASDDTTLRLWEIPAAAPLGQPLRGYPTFARIGSVAFAPDGRSVAATSIVARGSPAELRLWPVLDAWSDEVCRRVARNMSRTEWRDWVGPGIDHLEQCPGKPVPPDR